MEISQALRDQWPELSPRAALRLAHTHHDRCWTQQDAVDAWAQAFPDERAPEAKDISRWEAWPRPSGKRPSFDTLDKLAKIYECALSDLVADVSDYRQLDSSKGGFVKEDIGVVRRREFLAFTAAGAGTLALTQGSYIPQRVGLADVRRLEDRISDLFAMDDHFGGGAAYQRAVQGLEVIRHLHRHATCNDLTARHLRSLAGRTAEMAGWAAYDAGHHDEAHRWYANALVAADVDEDSRLRALVLTSMSQLALTTDDQHAALDLSHAAQRTARPFASPRWVSVLASREAVVWAHLGEGARAGAALTEAEAALDEDEGPDGEDEWLAFWCPSQLMGSVATVHSELGQTGEAEAAARQALALAPPEYRRNQVLNTVRLSRTLVARGEIDEGAYLALSAQSQLDGISSGRVRSGLADVKRDLQAHESVPAVKELLQA